MRDEILREVCMGKGHLTVKIPFSDIATYAHVQIDDLGEFEAVIQTILDNLTEADWLDLFEIGIINKYGFAITYEFAHNLDMEAGRKMVVLKRPVQAGSTKTLVDDTPISKLYVFGDALTEEMFGPDFHLAKISILLSDPETDDQIRHIDYKMRMVKDGDYGDSDFAVVIAYKQRGNLIVYDYSQHIIHACAEVENAGIKVSRGYSVVREKLEKNEHFKIGVHDCKKDEVFFGTDEMFIFGGNFIHGGAKNTMSVPVFKVHLYIAKKGREPPDNETVVLHNIAWDLTRKDATAKEIVFKELETRAQYVKHMKDTKGIDVDAKQVPKKSPSAAAGVAIYRNNKGKKTANSNATAEKPTDKATEKTASEASEGSSGKRGRPTKAKNKQPAEGGKKRGRPAKR